ncbi:MAG: hypothetical protein EBS90_12430 [Betaproteobacteria bacterium]|nr:hypothetical protein [Betaproteobacteria bacterium]
MIERGRVTDEDPACHWAHMAVNGRSRVLDLGCAFWDEPLRVARLGTPQFYLAKNPAFYLGIDANAADIQMLKTELGDHFICAEIISPAQLQCFLQGEKITHLMAGITTPLPDLQAAAIEVHGHDTHRAVEAWLIDQGLKIYRIDQQDTCADVHILYAQR